MSPLLQEFYDEMYTAINGKQPTWFLHSAGLCLNLQHFLDSKNIDIHFMYMKEIRMQFENVKMDRYYPFNKDHKQFHSEIIKIDNPLRRQWVIDHTTKVPLCGLPNPDHTKCSIERLGVCGCAFGQCAKGLIY